MFGDFFNFTILYSILVMMFAIVGCTNFLYDLPEFSGLFQAAVSVINYSIGRYDFILFEVYSSKEDSVIKFFGDFYVIGIVVIFYILLLNLMIAILSNTYNLFESKSSGLYLSKILRAREDMAYNENYGAFLLGIVPINLIMLPFVPFALVFKPSVKLNIFLTVLQYSFFIIIVYSLFLVVSILMIPFAFLLTLSLKAKQFWKADQVRDKFKKGIYMIAYAAVGLPLLTLSIFSDFYYFWKNNFRSKLKKIIIEKRKSTLEVKSIRQIYDYCNYYQSLKIRSVLTRDTVSIFRLKLNILENL